jgi:hypothetical protein
MATPVYTVTGIDHLSWEYIAFGEDERDVVLRFAGLKPKSFPKALDIAGLRMGDWYFTECVYNQCDEVRIFDRGDSAQLEFGRFTVQFVRQGEIVGEHSADSVAIRPAG